MTTSSAKEDVLRDYVIAEAKYQEVKAEYNEARKALLNLLPKEVGEHSLDIGKFTLTIKYPEKVVWDAEQLDALYGSDKPIHVKTSYSIDLRQLRKLPQAEQQALARCHEVKAGTPTIDIVQQ